MWKPVVSTVVRFGVAAIWLTSGIAKASDPSQTEIAVRAYNLLPNSAVSWVASALPFIEIALGLFLLLGLGTRIVSVLSVIGFGILIGVIASVWARGLKIDCGCFGGGGADANATASGYAWEIARDSAFLLLAAWLVYLPYSYLALGPRSRVRVLADDDDEHSEEELTMA